MVNCRLSEERVKKNHENTFLSKMQVCGNNRDTADTARHLEPAHVILCCYIV